MSNPNKLNSTPSNNSNQSTIVNFVWQVADDILRDVYVKGKYRDVILPMTVITRIDSELVATKEKTKTEYIKFKDRIPHIQPILEKSTGYPFYNISDFTLQSLLNDPTNITTNFRAYLNGFSANIQDILSKFKFYNQIDTLDESQILFALIQKFANKSQDLSPQSLSNHDMGTVFEELIRKFNEENNEEAGEHFTPREVIRLMTKILFLPIKDQIKDKPLSIYDPCCGSGGMLSIAEEFIKSAENGIESKGDIFLFGQELQPETYALCQSDMIIKGQKDNNIAFGSTLSNDGFPHHKFDFILTNPPYGKSWKTDQDKLAIGGKKKEILDTRFQVGAPRINDGQLLFMLHMMSKMKDDSPLGTRIASVHNGSALFTGDAGSGESEIRKHIIEKDCLEAIIALPKDLFYNTGIGTYIWILNNRKPKHKQGKVQLINAVGDEFYGKMSKSLGFKRKEIKPDNIQLIYDIFEKYQDSKHSKIFDNSDFGYTQIIVDRPDRNSPPKGWQPDVDGVFVGEIITDKKGNFKPDASLRDKENIPLKENIQEYFQREVLPFAPDAFYTMDTAKVGYEINFNKYFYEYTPPRELSEIVSDILALEQRTDGVLKQIIK